MARERNAWICGHKDCDPPRRVFLAPGEPKPRCADHGNTMRQQVNVPYTAPVPGQLPGQPQMIGEPRRRPRRPVGK